MNPLIIFLKILFIYLFIYLAVLGLCFCVRAFSSCGERGPLFIAVRGPLSVTASLVGEHRLQMRRLSSCGSRAQLLRGMWDLPRPGLKPVSPALAGRFSTTAPPGKPDPGFFSTHVRSCRFWCSATLDDFQSPLYHFLCEYTLASQTSLSWAAACSQWGKKV